MIVADEAEVGASLLKLNTFEFRRVWATEYRTQEKRNELPPEVCAKAIKRFKDTNREFRGSSTGIVERARAKVAAIVPRSEDEFAAALRTAQDIMAADSTPAAYCVDGRIPCGLVIIGAWPKFKKSWFALQLAIAKALGGQFMGVNTPGGRALCLFLEDNDRRMRKRFEFFSITPENAPANLHIVYDWPTGALGVEKLHRWLERFPDTRLIVVDVLQRFRGARERNASVYEADYATMGMLHGIAQQHEGLTVLVVHHVRNGAVDDPVEALNGSFGIAGSADAFIILRRGAKKNQVIAHIDGRDWESWEHEFLWEFRQGDGWVQLGVSEGELTATQQEIVRFARDNESITPTKLAEFRQISKSTAHEALQALVAKGAMRVYAGKYYPNGRE